MNDEILRQAEEVAVGIAGDAAGWIRTVPPSRVHAKTVASDLVTDQDPAIEAEIRDRLLKAFPDHRVVGEELGTSVGERAASLIPDGSDIPTWYVDPIDGTSNFAHSLPLCAVSISLVAGGRTLVGVVADPWRSEVFSARAGAGAWLNGEPIRVREEPGLAGRLVLTEWVGNRPWPGMHAFFDQIAEREGVVRILGSTALSLAQTASGRSSATVLGVCDPIDDAAGILIAQEAGALTFAMGQGIAVVAPGAQEALRSSLERAGAAILR